jgi:hypothetical protein
MQRQLPNSWGPNARCILAALLRARDRFDSDCVPGTQFESSRDHHALARPQRFPGLTRNAHIWRGRERRWSLQAGRRCRRGPLTRILWPRIPVSRKQRPSVGETGSTWMSDQGLRPSARCCRDHSAGICRAGSRRRLMAGGHRERLSRGRVRGTPAKSSCLLYEGCSFRAERCSLRSPQAW